MSVMPTLPWNLPDSSAGLSKDAILTILCHSAKQPLPGVTVDRLTLLSAPETRIDILQPKQRFDQVASGKQSVGSLRTRHRLLHLGRGTRALRIRRLSDEYRFQGYIPHRHTEQYGGRERHHRAGRPEPGRSYRPGRAGRKRRPADAADAYDAERLKE